MAKYRAQIIWEFDFDEKGITLNEYDYLDEDEDFSRTPEEMEKYAKGELYEYISDYHTDLWNAIDVVLVEE
jgi:hypothetical protein